MLKYFYIILFSLLSFNTYTNGISEIQVSNTIETQFNNYIDTTIALTPQARYNQGKLIFDVASMFFGVGEVKAFLKTGKLTSNTVQILSKIPANASKLLIALSGKIKKLQNNVLAYFLSANTYIEIARFSDEGTLLINKWLDAGEGIVGKVDDILINDEFTDALELIKRSDGALRWRLAFKEGLERNAEIVNKYFIELRNSSPPYKAGKKRKMFFLR